MSVDFNKIPSPCYVLDTELLRNNLRQIKNVQDQSEVEIIVAFKGFAFWNVFPIINEYIQGAAASGLYEARLAYEKLGALAHTYSPAFPELEFEEILKYSSHITFNSLSQVEKFLPRLKKYPRKISAGLRVNHEFSEVETELYNPCSPGSRLGVLAEQLNGTIPDGIEGLHFHSLCESYPTDLEKTLQAFEIKFGDILKKVKWVNFGGGHLMTRKGYDTAHLIKILKEFKHRHNVHVILEPGSAFAWETGYLVSTIQDIVINKGINTAILDVSFTAHMPDCLEMPYKPRIIGAHFDPIPGEPIYRMGGNSCLAGDYCGNWSFEKELQIGDKIIFEDMIHYTMVKTTFFNGVQHPSLGIWDKNEGFKLVRKFEYEDYLNKLS